MLQVNQISKSYGIQTILDEVTFVVNQGERAGLVGPNGCGKTTLLRIIAGLERADNGHVSLDSSATVGYLPQGPEPAPGRSVSAAVQAGIAGLEAARQQVKRLAARMAETQGEALEEAISAYGEALGRFEALGGYTIEHRAAEILAGLGLAALEPDTPLEQLSGGQRARVGLARLLLAEPGCLLLDEPTNHLDIDALEWLERFLGAYRGVAVIASHDRTFLDRTVSRILELDEKTHRITAYSGNYSDYVLAKGQATEKQWAAWQDQRAEIRRIEADVRRTRAQAQRTERATINDHARRLAKKVAKKAKARERRLQRFLESEDRVEKPERAWQMNLAFGPMPRGGQIVVSLVNVGHAFAGRWLFRQAELTLQHGERIALLGPNGSGKTTLLRLIANELTPSEGSIRVGANVRLGYMPQEQQSLAPEATPLALIRQAAPLTETEARSFLHFFLFAVDDVFVPIEKLSYGERARLLLAKLVVDGANCLLLDEPINHLDIPARERFEGALAAFPGTVLVAVHDRAFIDRFATGIWALEGTTVRQYGDRQEMEEAA